jgi:hypothetical protein
VLLGTARRGVYAPCLTAVVTFTVLAAWAFARIVIT